MVYTREETVQLCLAIARRALGRPFLGARVLDIGCGYGQFSVPIAAAIVEEAIGAGENQSVGRILRTRLRGIEICPSTAEMTRAALASKLDEMACRRVPRLVLDTVIQSGDFLTWAPDTEPFDLIVGNLPYVRHDEIQGLDRTLGVSELRQQFSAFRGRADYSVPVLQRALELLAPDGVAVLITSNRFTRSDYGAEIRKILAGSTRQVHEIDLSHVRAFETVVSAYASIFVLLPAKPERLSASPAYVRLLTSDAEVLGKLGRGFPHDIPPSPGYQTIRRSPLPVDGSPWSVIPRPVEDVLKRLRATSPELGSLGGVDVRKGPATGADSVFIGPAEQFPFGSETVTQFLLPVFDWSTGAAGPAPAPRYLLSVYEPGTGKLIPFNDLPFDVQRYLNRHRRRLEKRHIVAARGKEWWRTIDVFDPLLLREPKAMVPDLLPASRTRLDLGNYFPAHSVVCVSGTGRKLLRGVHAVLRSPIAEEFRFWRSPDLGPRSPRASAKVLRQLPMPPLSRLVELGRTDGCAGEVFEAFGLSSGEAAEFLSRQSGGLAGDERRDLHPV